MRFKLFNKERKDNFDKIFEDVQINQNQPIQQTQNVQQKPKKETKDDKIDKLKQYNEYWMFEKNYHFNSEIDKVIKKVNSTLNPDKKERIKLMKDIINQICGSAAKYLGLSWDMIGDDKYLFGFYETTGSKYHMQIMIPYDFKFSNLKDKLLDWFFKKKQKETQNIVFNNSNEKKPSIKIVENRKTFDFDTKRKMNEAWSAMETEDTEDDVEQELNYHIAYIEFEDKDIEKAIIEIFGDENDKKIGKFSKASALKVTEMTEEIMEKYAKEHNLSHASFEDVIQKFKKSYSFGKYYNFTELKEFKNLTKISTYFFDINLTKISFPDSIKQIEMYTPIIEIVQESFLELCKKDFKRIRDVEKITVQDIDNYLTDGHILKLPKEITKISLSKFFSLINPNIDTVIIENPNFTTIEGAKLFSCKNITFIFPNNDFEKWFEINISYESFYQQIVKIIDKNKTEKEIKYFKQFFDKNDVIDLRNAKLTKLGENIFSNLGAKKIYLPNTLTKITKKAFYYANIKEIEIPNSVTEIEDEAFYHSEFEIIHLPETLEKIGKESFRDCCSLKEINIPKSIKEIGEKAFLNSQSFFKEKCLDLSKYKNLTKLGESCFYGTEIEEIIFPENVKELNSTCSFCKKLKKATLPKNVEKLESTFYNCEKLEEINEIPKTVNTFKNVFKNCYHLKEIYFETLPSNWKEFSGLSKIHLDYYQIPKGIKTLGEINIKQNRKNSWSLKHNLINTELQECEIDKLIVPEGVTAIGHNVFKESNIKTLILPSTIETIGNNAFGMYRGDKGSQVIFSENFSKNSINFLGEEPFGYGDWNYSKRHDEFHVKLYLPEKIQYKLSTLKKYDFLTRKYDILVLHDNEKNSFYDSEKSPLDTSKTLNTLPYEYGWFKRELKANFNTWRLISAWEYEKNNKKIPTFPKNCEIELEKYIKNNDYFLSNITISDNKEFKTGLGKIKIVNIKKELPEYLENFFNKNKINKYDFSNYDFSNFKIIYMDSKEIDINFIVNFERDNLEKEIGYDEKFNIIFALILNEKDLGGGLFSLFNNDDIKNVTPLFEPKDKGLKKAKEIYFKGYKEYFFREREKAIQRKKEYLDEIKQKEKLRKQREKEWEKQKIKAEKEREREYQRYLKKQEKERQKLEKKRLKLESKAKRVSEQELKECFGYKLYTIKRQH